MVPNQFLNEYIKIQKINIYMIQYMHYVTGQYTTESAV